MLFDFEYIMENNNGDVIIFYFFVFNGVVMVIDCGGKYCFNYIGYLLRLELYLLGICIDVFLYILVCDGKIKIV